MSSSRGFASASGASMLAAGMLAVDADVLVRLLARDDAVQALAADRAVAKGAWVPHLVLAEAVRQGYEIVTTEPSEHHGPASTARSARAWVALAVTVAIALFGGPLYELSERAAQSLVDPSAYIGAVLP